jgi:hypothetical protein
MIIASRPVSYQVVNKRTDTWEINVKVPLTQGQTLLCYPHSAGHGKGKKLLHLMEKAESHNPQLQQALWRYIH